MAAQGLHQGLKQRHLTMIAIGGVIGAGLFVGSGVVINSTGPGAFLTYALCGLLIVMVMQMLGEMAVAKPSTGSFADYARDALGPWAGFSVAWLYWYFWVIVVGFEAVAGAKILTYWIDAPLWLLSLGLMVVMTLTNLYSVRSFGEFEYWFAGIKVAAIVVFLVLGSLFVLGLLPGAQMDFSNLTAHGGFLPQGPAVLLSGIVIVVFSMVGAEVATIAGAESDDPMRAVTKATRSVVWRILLFFVGSVFLLAVILPWNSTELGASPYVSAFERIGIPFAAGIMNAVVLTSVLSCLNSGLYTASRMLFVLAGRREAPPAVLRVTKRGIPTYAILMSTVVGFGCVLAAYISPTGVFSFLLNSSGAVILFAYTLIAASQLVLRRRADARGQTLGFRMWLFPWLTIATIVSMVAILISMAVRADTRPQITLGLASWAFLLIVFRVIKRYREAGVQDAEQAAQSALAHRLLVLANADLPADELLRQVGVLGSDRYVECYVCVPQNVAASASGEVCRERLDDMVATLHAAGIPTEGAIGDAAPGVALDDAVRLFVPDSILIVRPSHAARALLPDALVHRARDAYDVPVHDVVASEESPRPTARADLAIRPRATTISLPADAVADVR